MGTIRIFYDLYFSPPEKTEMLKVKKTDLTASNVTLP